MEKIICTDLPALFQCIASIMQKNESYLCQLDAEMGDGDLGLTMRRGFSALPEAAEALLETERDVSGLLVKAGMKMAGIAPSTMGTLMGSGLMGAGRALSGRDAIDGDGLAIFYQGFAEGLAKRGKCAPGDRTVLDAVAPAAQRAAACAQRDLPSVSAAALAGARAGLEATKDMPPKFGKAAVFSNKAAGRVDQGAVVGALFAEAVAQFCSQQSGV